MPPNIKTALFIKHGRFSGINESLARQLQLRLPGYSWRIADVRTDWLKGKLIRRLWNYAEAAWYFRKSLLTRKRALHEVYLRTPGMFRLLRQCAAQQAALTPDLAFTFATQSLYDLAVPGVPHFIFTDHTHLANLYYPTFKESDLLPSFVNCLEKEIYANARRVFVMGSHVRRSLIEQYQVDPGACETCGGGANFRHLPALANQEFGNKTIGFVGIDWERKGGATLLEAFRIVRRQIPDARLQIVGCDEVSPEPGVTWHGRLPQEQVAQVLSTVSVFAFPTLVEPFGLAPIEASALGLPVVTTRIGAMPDVVLDQQTGLLVEPNQPKDLSAALLKLLSRPELAAHFGNSAREHVLKNFTWDVVGLRVAQGIKLSLSSS